MKRISFSIYCLVIILPIVAKAQKGTDHDKFARKFYQHYSYDESKVENLLPDAAALSYISSKTGEPLDALQARNEQQRKFLKSDLSKLSDAGENKKNVIDDSRIEIKQETPIKVADILLMTHWGSQKFTILLQNCVQTDKGWFLGDFVGLQDAPKPDRGAFIKKEAAVAEQNVDEAKKFNAEMVAREMADQSREMKLLPGVHWTGTYIFGERNGAPFFFNASSANLPDFTGKQYPDLFFNADGKCEGKIWVPGPDLSLTGTYSLEGNLLRITGQDTKSNYEVFHVSTKRLVLKDIDKNLYYTLTSKEAMEKESSSAQVSSGSGKIKPWVGPTFAMQNADPVTQYFKMDLIEKPLRGFYIDKNGRKVNAVIKYQEPGKLCEAYSTLLLYKIAFGEDGFTEDETNNFIKFLPKDSVIAFSVGDQVFVPVQTNPRQWGVLRSEGGIRQVVVVAKVASGSKSGYLTSVLLDKLNGKKVNTASIALSFKNTLSDLVSDHSEMASKISSRTEGYRLMQLDAIIAEYNTWYDAKYPGAVQYLFYDDGTVAWRKKD